jgi:zinc D-Ala-D-Ala carboxypeptidase
VKYFKVQEFADPTEPGSGMLMDVALLDMLEEVRERCAFPFRITSGYRYPSHNKEVGGKPNSDHVTGNAVDIAVSTGAQRFLIVKHALEVGFRRIGVKKDCIHLGNAPNLPQDVIWTYD